MYYKAAIINFTVCVAIYVLIQYFLFHDQLNYTVKTGCIIATGSTLFLLGWLRWQKRAKKGK